jgi:hypothetical protein
MPELETGLRARSDFLASSFTGYVSPHVRSIDLGQEVALDGGTVWDALNAVDPDAADNFRRAVGWRPGAQSGWTVVQETTWIYDPRTQSVRAG